MNTELRFKEAINIIKWWLNHTGFIAIVMPWGTCYFTQELDEYLIRHEKEHWEQYQRHGRIKFLIMYCYYSFKYGYHDNPFEVEARKAELKR